MSVRIAKNGSSGPYKVVKVYGHPLFSEGERVYLHQFILCNKIGRRLTSKEESHHKDGNKQNNSPGNLMVKPKGKHQTDHNKEWYRNATPEQMKARGAAISKAKKGKPVTWGLKISKKLKGLVRSGEFKSKVSSGMGTYCKGLPAGEMMSRFSGVSKRGKG